LFFNSACSLYHVANPISLSGISPPLKEFTRCNRMLTHGGWWERERLYGSRQDPFVLRLAEL
jgi:hypothetical protein